MTTFIKDLGHQGDVQFKTILSLPKGALPIDHTPIAYGEHSGHVHVVTGDVQLFKMGDAMYAVTGNDGGYLQHLQEKIFASRYSVNEPLEKADHLPIRLEPNQIYTFGIHQRFNPFKRVQEKVID